jgi:hypothetical protein
MRTIESAIDATCPWILHRPLSRLGRLVGHLGTFLHVLRLLGRYDRGLLDLFHGRGGLPHRRRRLRGAGRQLGYRGQHFRGGRGEDARHLAHLPGHPAQGFDHLPECGNQHTDLVVPVGHGHRDGQVARGDPLRRDRKFFQRTGDGAGQENDQDQAGNENGRPRRQDAAHGRSFGLFRSCEIRQHVLLFHGHDFIEDFPYPIVTFLLFPESKIHRFFHLSLMDHGNLFAPRIVILA